MGTRGVFGFFYKGKYYVCYNHSDSYPGGLGVKLILEILNANLDEWIELLEKITLVDENKKSAPADVERLKKYTDLSVSTRSTDDWYCLLRLAQGSFYHVLHSGYIINHVDKDGEPMREEYAYILNFDDQTLDFNAYHYSGEEEEGAKLKIPLKEEDLYVCAKKWNGEDLSKQYDPEEDLLRHRKLVEKLTQMF